MPLKRSLAAFSLLAAITTPALPLWAQEGETTTLDAVVVTASRTEETVREVTANTTVIGREQIRTSTANSLDQLLAQQGFQVINQGTQKTLRIRGMGQKSLSTEMSSNVLVLLNGRRIGINNMALMGLANVERVEIIRGPSAVQYGSSAMGGVVNIITRRGEEGFTGSMEAGLGSFGLDKQEMALSGGAGVVDFAAGLTRSSRDDYKVKGGHTWPNTSYDEQTNMNLDLGFSFLEKHRFGINYNYYNQNDAYSPSSGWSNTGAIGKNEFFNNYDLRNTNLAFTYEGGPEDDRISWLFRLANGQDETSGLNKSEWGTFPEETTLDNRSLTAQVNYDGGLLAVSTGFDYIRYDVDGTYEGLASQENSAGFISAKLRLFEEKVIVSAGGRYDRFTMMQDTAYESSVETNFAPSVGLAYLPVEWLKLRTNYSEGFRMPTPKEIYGSGAYYIPNGNLKPEKSNTYEVGADVSWEFVETGLTYFNSDWKDRIYANPVDPVNMIYQYQNIEAVRLSGLEYNLEVNLGQAFDQDFDLTPYFNLTYMLSRKNKDAAQVRENKSDIIPYTPKILASYGLRFNQPDWGLTSNINVSYSGKSLSKDWRDQSPTNGQFIEESGGTVVDMGLTKQLFEFKDHNTLKAKFEINNIFDGKNEAYLDYPNPGRNFYVGLIYEYK